MPDCNEIKQLKNMIHVYPSLGKTHDSYVWVQCKEGDRKIIEKILMKV